MCCASSGSWCFMDRRGFLLRVGQTPDFTAKKGTIVIPSLWASCRNGYDNGEEFLPERFAEEGADRNKAFMPFGCGNHACVGQRYAIHHLICFLAVMATASKGWTRITKHNGPLDVGYYPTL
jgi:hypothetical protein